MTPFSNPIPDGQRGPADHERREQIIAAAHQHFAHYGFEKTTIADLATAIGLSKAYIYKFFQSKQAIGEAVCSSCLARISDQIQEIAVEKAPASDRLRRIFNVLAHQSAVMFFQDRKLYDLTSTSLREKWGSARKHDAKLLSIVQTLLQEGREAGEFERKTPLNETARAIMLAIQPIHNPLLFQHALDTLDEDATLMANLVLRSLAP